jgi:hypothetical protein
MRWPVIAVAASLVAIMAAIAFTGILNPIVQIGFDANDSSWNLTETIPRSIGHALPRPQIFANKRTGDHLELQR